MMSSIKATHIILPATVLFCNSKNVSKRRDSILCFSKADGRNGESSSPSQGDRRKQEILAQIAMLQAQKVRLTNFLDERTEKLTKFGEEANAEFERIGEDALKGLNEAESRIMENLDSQMEEYEETAELNRQEIEKNEQVLKAFEEKMDKDRNEGLFFKNLRTKTPQAKAEAKAEAQKIKQVTIENAGFMIRRNIYFALMSLLAFTIANALASFPEVDWRKVGALVFIFAGLVAQVIYEQSLSSKNDNIDKGEGGPKKE